MLSLINKNSYLGHICSIHVNNPLAWVEPSSVEQHVEHIQCSSAVNNAASTLNLTATPSCHLLSTETLLMLTMRVI